MTKVLVVEDSIFIRNQTVKLLLEHGFDVIEADDGEIAVDIYTKDKPDLVLMDISLPRLNGIEATKKIMAMDPEAKIGMFSAMGQQSAIIEAIKAGAKDFVVKPFDPNKILKTIERILNS